MSQHAALFAPAEPDADDGTLGLLNELEDAEAEEERPAHTGCSERFISLHPIVRWLIVFAVVGGLAGLLVGLLIKFQPAPRAPPDSVRPVVVTTWFANANDAARQLLQDGYSAMDAVELGCRVCEDARCDGTVGWGGGEDANGTVSLDAMFVDGETHDVGAVTYLRRVRHAISAARKVLHYSKHSLLAGDGADDFAAMMGLAWEPLNSNESDTRHAAWVAAGCPDNKYDNVVVPPGVASACGPYTPLPTPTYTPAYTPPLPGAARAVTMTPTALPRPAPLGRVPRSRTDHDTIAMCAIDRGGRIVGGGSTNGERNKVPGRSSDIAVIGAGVYADREGGCAAATGDGDITARLLPAFAAVEFMRLGGSPTAACEHAVRRIMAFYSTFELGIVCVDRYGAVGAASHGWTFTYAVAVGETNTTTVVPVPPLT